MDDVEEALGILCDKMMPSTLKVRFYEVFLRPITIRCIDRKVEQSTIIHNSELLLFNLLEI